jgi:hypothetical protein
VNPLVTYSLARLALFVATLGLLAWAGAGQIWAVVYAAVISMLLSYVLLRPLRDRAARQIAVRVQRHGDERVGHGSVEGPDEFAEDAEVERSLAEVERSADSGSAEQQSKPE